ncbi:hypothetical protein F966_03288 [Acinetobacter higginsii]|uniref:Uncharacterized protein n=1 Tax=Acinetobacter higginsii TaxID=70347 RepID=N8XHU0_9GAMM|nr:hypothetical protein [Acinetobacter higginsii]ENV08614.1 hypothetical protein F966_03288 [Acinetobacter higginsii]
MRRGGWTAAFPAVGSTNDKNIFNTIEIKFIRLKISIIQINALIVNRKLKAINTNFNGVVQNSGR